MSEDKVVKEGEFNLEPLVQDELESLKLRATQIGFKFHHRVKAEKLKKQIEAYLKAESAAEKKAMREAAAAELAPVESKESLQIPLVVQTETAGQRRNRLHKEAAKLVRIRVSNMNPMKKNYDGEIFTVSNGVVGTFRKYVPFNVDAGWHVPQIILNHMKEKKCQVFHEVTRNGMKMREGKLIRELNIEILPPLTPKEIKSLATQQAMAAGDAV